VHRDGRLIALDTLKASPVLMRETATPGKHWSRVAPTD
jgi:hypothetical protein